MLEKLKNKLRVNLDLKNQNNIKPSKENRIVARVIHSTYRGDILENQICEFENPNSTIELFLVTNESYYFFGPISNIDRFKKRRKERLTIQAYAGTITLEIISQPIKIHVLPQGESFNLEKLLQTSLLNKKKIKQVIPQHLNLLATEFLSKKSTATIIDKSKEKYCTTESISFIDAFDTNADKPIIVRDYRVI